MCGEQVSAPEGGSKWPGSPPRVRGTVNSRSVMEKGGRITPACAGNSAHLPCLPFWLKDHPRVCGEQHDFR